MPRRECTWCDEPATTALQVQFVGPLAACDDPSHAAALRSLETTAGRPVEPVAGEAR
jgi:hypothetical protein